MVQPKSEQQYFNSDSKLVKKPNTSPGNYVQFTSSKNNDDDEEYLMTGRPKGRAIIFNNATYQANLGLSEREGSKVDKQRITRVLVSLGFETEICDDFTFAKIKEKLQQVSEDDHSSEHCLVVVVMSHGTTSKVFAYDQAYDEQELWRPFSGNNCPTLLGKPKLFFIEACRGPRDGTGSFFNSPVTPQRNGDGGVEWCSVPSSADLLIARSTVEGYKSYRNPEGSRFIQTLCNELEADISRDNYRKYDLMRILTNVNRNVAFNYPAEIGTEKKQMPKIYSTLTKLIYFRTND